MPLTAGARIGPYEIVAAIGAGGMGEVYRARDTRLERDVAIKIVPELFAADHDRLARFEREAKTLALLNHPNIAHIHGIEGADIVRALVMEFVDGEDLAERLKRGPIPVADAIAIARQIAGALEAAHERGVVHRDLKPANVKVRDDGTVKVLDFGLSKALGPAEAGDRSGILHVDLQNSPTFTSPATQLGVILGTAAYMAPEQAKGKVVDKRTDIWSFGVVLYEMLTGRSPFPGETITDVLAHIVSRDPDWSQLPSDTPPAVHQLLARCLERDPKDRLRDIGDAAVFLDAPPVTTEPSAPVRTSRLAHIVWAAACAVAAVAGAWIAGAWKTSAELPVRRFELRLPVGGTPDWNSAAISPDGSTVAYVGAGRLWIHELRALESREIPGAAGAMRPFWSSDSQWVAYGIGRRLWKAPAGGGSPVAIADLSEEFSPAAGGAWDADGRIVFTTGFTGLLEVSDRGGDVRVLLPVNADTELDFHEVSLLPESRGVLFYVHGRPGQSGGGIEVFDGSRRKVVHQEAGLVLDHPVYSPTGHLLYRRSPTNVGIWAVPFSLDTLETTGEPFLLAAGSQVPSASREGTLVYSAGGSELGLASRLTWVDRAGASVGAVGEPEAGLGHPALSRDGRRVAVATLEGIIWVYDVAEGTRSKVTLESGLNLEPAWFPDGTRLVHVARQSYDAGLPRIVARGVDGAGSATPIADGQSPNVSTDGRHLVYQTYGGRANVMRVDLAQPGQPQPVLNDPKASERFPVISPDVRWLAFVSDASGRDEVCVTSFPDGRRTWQVSAGGGQHPTWRPDGRELFYLDGDTLMAVTVARGDSPSFGSPAKLFWASRLSAGFDVAPDGKRFLTIQSDEDKAVRTITVVQNWIGEFGGR